MPLHLFDGSRTTSTPPAADHFRRLSAGMSLKRRYWPAAFQIGPSVNVQPLTICSTSTSSATRSKTDGDLATTPIPLRSFLGSNPGKLGRDTSTEKPISFRLLPPSGARAGRRLAGLGVDAGRRHLEAPAVPAGARRDDLGEDREGGLRLAVGA